MRPTQMLVSMITLGQVGARSTRFHCTLSPSTAPTDTEIEDAMATLQGERRRRKRNAKPAAEVPAPFEEPDDVTGRSWTRGNAELRVIG